MMVRVPDQFREVTRLRMTWTGWTTLRGLLFVGLLGCLNGPAHALVVGSAPGTVPDTTVNPANYGPGWTKGDPGFNSFSLSSGYVYLGDGWVLSARHVGYNPANGVQFQTGAGPVTFKMAGAKVAADGVTLVPGPYYTDYGFDWSNGHHFAVSNPATIQRENGQPLTLSTYTDLQLFRINGDPGLPALAISSQPLPNNYTASTAPELMLMGNSAGRAASETHWNLTGNSPDIVWTVTTGAGDEQGYLNDGNAAKRWGTNRVTDPANLPSNIISGVVSNTTAVIPLSTGVGAIARDIIANATQYDRTGEAGTTAFESQAISGDSGGAVFYKRNDTQWELAGIVSGVLNFEDQPGSTAVYGNTTVISDLSYYNQDYLHSIKQIIESHPDYSIMGDLNLDGVVSGNGTGPVATDDISAFVAGWRTASGVADITAWTKGDLNRDGKTDATDFFKLRQACSASTSCSPAGGASAMALILGIAVPEPTTVVLALWLAGFLIAALSRRRVACSRGVDA